MSTAVFLTVLLAALLHAGWNAIVKGDGDKYMAMLAVVIGQGIFAVPALFFVPAPDAGSFPYLAVGLVLHLGYQFFLMASYKIGDLTQVYPLARGSAPIIVTLVSVFGLGIMLAPMQLVAVGVIALGIISISLVRRSDGQRNPYAAVLALVTGSFIAGYSLVDGIGAREAGTALGFYGWLAISNAVVSIVIVGIVRPRTFNAIPTRNGIKITLIGGGASYAAYALVMWAFTQAPIALVTALRETSIIFAMIIGVFVLHEKVNLMKIISTMLTLAGVALLRFTR